MINQKPKFKQQVQPSLKKFLNFIFLNFVLTAFAITVFYSCDDREKLDGADINMNNEQISSRNPSTVGDRVYFTDFADFKDYYLDLDDILTTYNGDYFDSIVDVMTSVQTLNDVVMASVGTFGTVSDPILRAIVNGYNEFQVDDVLVTIINNSQWLLSDVSDGTLKTSIRAITKGVPLSLANVPGGAQWTESDQFEEALAKFWCGCTIRIEPFDCETLRVSGNCHGFFGTHGGGDVTVTLFPDAGGSSLLIDEEVSNSFEFFVDISVFNNDEGLLWAVADSHCDSEIDEGEAFYNFDPALFAECDRREADMVEIIISPNSDEQMVVTTSFNKTDWTDTHKVEIRSFSSSNHGSTWDKTKANLTLSVDANRLDFGDCDFLDHKFDDESVNSKHHRVVRVTWGGDCAHCTGDLTGVFQKVRNNVTLNKTQIVEFVCCE